MKITVLEDMGFTPEQKDRLASLGQVEYYQHGEDLSTKTALELTKDSDVVVVNWIDPSPFILSMKTPSLVALMSTGFGWIQHMDEARERGTLVANIPAYATEAVAEHIFGLLLSFMKRINISSNWTREESDRAVVFGKEIGVVEKGTDSLVGRELQGKTIGIIGLGNIGSRVAELSKAFGMKTITFNRTPKNNPIAEDVSLETLLSRSDIVCVTCPLNADSKQMLNGSNFGLLKKNAVLTGATWGVIEENTLLEALKNNAIAGAAFDVALEGAERIENDELLTHPHFLCTKHNAYNTFEAAERQKDICIDNIESFLNATPLHIVN